MRDPAGPQWWQYMGSDARVLLTPQHISYPSGAGIPPSHPTEQLAVLYYHNTSPTYPSPPLPARNFTYTTPNG
jgi:hypothetical protein